MRGPIFLFASMNAELDLLVNEARAAFSAALQPAALQNEKARYLGKNGAITERLKTLAKLTPDEKRTAGAEINAAKEAIEVFLTKGGKGKAEVKCEFEEECGDVRDHEMGTTVV